VGGGGRREPYWLSPRMRETLAGRRERYPRRDAGPVRSPWQRDLLGMLDNAIGCQIMEHVDRSAARAGLEKRHPLGDPRIVQFAFSTPERLRMCGDRTKYLHVQAMQGLMPPTVLERRTKAEFSVVFREALDRMEGHLTRTLPRAHPDRLSENGVRQLFDVYLKNRHFGWPLWIFWGIYGCNAVFQKETG
jgi:asparagine synthase (glutamine-hydrolysing)